MSLYKVVLQAQAFVYYEDTVEATSLSEAIDKVRGESETNDARWEITANAAHAGEVEVDFCEEISG